MGTLGGTRTAGFAVRVLKRHSVVRRTSNQRLRSENPMSNRKSLSAIGSPVPELPVEDVERTQQCYRDILGFEIGWLDPSKR